MLSRALPFLVLVLAAPAAAAAAVPAPKLQTPADAAVVSFAPAFTWAKAKGAAKYEFQIAADRGFGSIISNGTIKTRNTAATLTSAPADGAYFWRVRGIDSKDRAGKWSGTRVLAKAFSAKPALQAPASGSTVVAATQALVLRWSPVVGAVKYQVTVATDSSLASPVLNAVETQGSVLGLPGSLADGQTYYWAVAPLDAQNHRGARSDVATFLWTWPSTVSNLQVADSNPEARVVDPRFSWNPVPGAAKYELEVNSSDDFAPESKVCCEDPTTGTSLSPTKVFLDNDSYRWRVRARDADNNAGAWTTGPNFARQFNRVTAPDKTIPNLHMRDNNGALDTTLGTPTTSAPVVDWDPVPGASSYVVSLMPWIGGSCQTGNQAQYRTAASGWTPMDFAGASSPVQEVTNRVAAGGGLTDGTTYCVRVFARTDRDGQNREVVSQPTQIGATADSPAFTYDAADPGSPPGGTLFMPLSNYDAIASGSTIDELPTFTWDAVAGAKSYWVVVARDPLFRNVVDVAVTDIPAYAPRDGQNPTTYADENTPNNAPLSLYWAVIPAKGDNGSNYGGSIATHSCSDSVNNQGCQQFAYKTQTPEPVLPAEGSIETGQPTFSWSSAKGARQYVLEIAQDQTFANPIDTITTDATSYTASDTYPADTVLYWRVRTKDENLLNRRWSAVRTLRRKLPAPTLDGANPTEGESIPVLRWSPVQGAVSYGVHIEQPDGTKKDFEVRTPAFTPTEFYGTGVWGWQVRANFPRRGFGQVQGPYTGLGSFLRRIKAPIGAHGFLKDGRVLIGWESATNAKRYQVQVSDTNSFATISDSTTTDLLEWAPTLDSESYRAGGSLYWRVASVDSGGNVGAYATGTFTVPKRLVVEVPVGVVHGFSKGFEVTVRDGRGRAVRKARVKLTGKPVRSVAKRTNTKGVAKFKLRYRRKGTIKVTAVLKGYRSASATVRVQ
jgi:hypothetical protein